MSAVDEEVIKDPEPEPFVPPALVLQDVIPVCSKCHGTGVSNKDFELLPNRFYGTDPEEPEFIKWFLPCSKCEGAKRLHHPHYTVGEVAKVFFNRSGHWVRWREGRGDFEDPDGEEAGGRTEHGARSYTIPDVERMLHTLVINAGLSEGFFMRTFEVVKAEAMLYGYLSSPWEDDAPDEDDE